MGKKYIIELKDNTAWLQWVNVVDDGTVYFDYKYPEDLTPYTEPDLEQVRKEAFEKGYSTAVAEQECAVRGAAEKGYQKGYETGYKDGYNEPGKNQQEAYQRGLNDAWEAARKICTNWVLSDSVLSEIFGMDKTIDDIMKENTASEVIEKIRQYEQENEEIQVGDEVVGTYTGEEETEPFVIIRKIPEIRPTYYFGIYSKSGKFCQGGLKLKKTGRHFPEIAEVLRKMKGEST